MRESNHCAPGVMPVRVSLRYGIKGPAAAEWLATRSVSVPHRANAVSRWPGGRCLRLGHTEFMVESDLPVDPARHSAQGVTNEGPGDAGASVPNAVLLSTGVNDSSADGAWTLLRSDHSVILRGEPWPRALSHACSFDFERLREEPDQVVMTLLAGISVTLIREDDAFELALRLWCDASFATYLNHCLHQLAATCHLGEQR